MTSADRAMMASFTYDNAVMETLNSQTDCNTTITKTFTVNDIFVIQDLNIGLNVEHSWRGDVQISLTSPSGVEVVLLNFNEPDNFNNFDVLVDDASASLFDDGDNDNVSIPNYGLDRIVAPENPLSVFNGTVANGVWTLSFCNVIQGTHSARVLTFNSAQLQFTGELTELCGNGVDDDGDGDIDCEDADCQNIQLSNLTVSNCIDQPLVDVATVDVQVSWSNPPANDTIEVHISNQIEYLNVAGGVGSPQTIRFTVPADGTTNNRLWAAWRNTASCPTTTSYDAPNACSMDSIGCSILYICGNEKPYDGDSWDHGWLRYLDAVNGDNELRPVLAKADASGMGLYDPENQNDLLTVDLENYDLVIVSATTENYISDDLIITLRNTSAAVLNSNFLITNDLGLTATEADYQGQQRAYTKQGVSEQIYNYNNKISPIGGKVILNGDYRANAEGFLWIDAIDVNQPTNSALFYYSKYDTLPNVLDRHGERVFLGYHMNGVYGNNENGGNVPVPDSLWFDPVKHLTLVGKTYLDSALLLATMGCRSVSPELGNYVWFDANEDGIQDEDEMGLSGISVSLFDELGDSLTTVITDANGLYYFNEQTGTLDANTIYYIVIGKNGQFDNNTEVLNNQYRLSPLNRRAGIYQDWEDSDGFIGRTATGDPAPLDGYPIIEVRTGANGKSDKSNDFGFRNACTPALAVNDTIILCSGTMYNGSAATNDENVSDKAYAVLTAPTHGTLIMNTNGAFDYTNTAQDCGIDSFEYEVCDVARICCAQATVYLDYTDTIAPVLQNIPANDTISCDEIIPLPPQIFAIDNCPRISLDVQEVSTQGEDGCSLYDYTITRTWEAVDECGNTTTGSQTIDVQDVVAPDIFRVYTLPNGKKVVAGVMEFVGRNWKTVNLPIDFPTQPVVLHQVVTTNETTPVVSQIQNTSVAQFELRIKEEEANDNRHIRESVAWIAIEAGTQTTDYQLESNSLLLSDLPQILPFQNAFAASPLVFTSSQTTNEIDPFTVRQSIPTNATVNLNLQEEASADPEMTHVNETVGFLALENTGEMRTQEGVLMGESGSVTANGTWATVNLNHTFHNPVVIANSLSNNDNEAAMVRVRNVGLTSFEIRVEEWEYLDGTHGDEEVAYLVIEGSIPLESPNYCDTGTDSLEVGIDFKSVDNCDVSVVINYTEDITFLNATKVITRRWSAVDECGNGTAYEQEIRCEGVSIRAKAALQGALLENNEDGLMRDDLRQKSLIPSEEPYTKMMRFTHVGDGGGEVLDPALLAVNGANAIVDWVFVELRDPNDINNVKATLSALIQRDGDVISVNGDSLLHFTNTRVGNYYVAIRHRNHLGLTTADTYTFSLGQIPFVDFTFDFTPVVGLNVRTKKDNVQAMWSGDLNSDGKIIYQGPNNDIFFMFLHVLQDEGNVDFLPNYISIGYTNDDFNLDGSVIYQGPNNDRALLLFNTILTHPSNPQKFSNFVIYEDGN
ncbi:MAG: SdrD B-like domain-containing protein [Bacteroidota bacterium]